MKPIRMWKLDTMTGYCGVLMPINVMKKLAKINAKYIADVRDLISEHKEELQSYSWTMSETPDPVYVHFKDKYCDTEARIRLFEATKPQKVDFYDTDDRDLAKNISDKLKKAKDEA